MPVRDAVYVVKSRHFSDDFEASTREGILLERDLRFAAIQTIVDVLGSPKPIPFFIDGLIPWVALDLDKAYADFETLEDYSKVSEERLKELERELRDLEKRHYEAKAFAFEHLSFYYRLLPLGIRGKRVTFRKTETNRGIKLPVPERDDLIYRRLQREGSRINLVYVGLGHPLTTLSASPDFEVYTTSVIRKDEKTILVESDVPHFLRNDLSSRLSQVDLGDNQLFLGF